MGENYGRTIILRVAQGKTITGELVQYTGAGATEKNDPELREKARRIGTNWCTIGSDLLELPDRNATSSCGSRIPYDAKVHRDEALSQFNPARIRPIRRHTGAASFRQNPRRATCTPGMILPRRGSQSDCMTGSCAPHGRSVGVRPRLEAGTDVRRGYGTDTFSTSLRFPIPIPNHVHEG
ncbi:hypothetical protein N7474_007725 [Penicillium riverlandense]|uniref:uncharacterized protein n=1 Tax=Penicillium riverlandense TaxID=1903569 RepID=UPI00254938B4|nr:uncharacterized protein N7474_007725 [Penicillium riverlandense]KAJ5811424.1 hypothetical protein N7474_007725 [Penicillium riverlandense]